MRMRAGGWERGQTASAKVLGWEQLGFKQSTGMGIQGQTGLERLKELIHGSLRDNSGHFLCAYYVPSMKVYKITDFILLIRKQRPREVKRGGRVSCGILSVGIWD